MAEGRNEGSHRTETVVAENGSSVQKVTVVLPEDARGYLRWVNGMSIAVAVAIALSFVNLIFMWTVARDMGQEIYWKQRVEIFLEQLSEQGIKVPNDLLHHPKKE